MPCGHLIFTRRQTSFACPPKFCDIVRLVVQSRQLNQAKGGFSWKMILLITSPGFTLCPGKRR